MVTVYSIVNFLYQTISSIGFDTTTTLITKNNAAQAGLKPPTLRSAGEQADTTSQYTRFIVQWPCFLQNYTLLQSQIIQVQNNSKLKGIHLRADSLPHKLPNITFCMVRGRPRILDSLSCDVFPNLKPCSWTWAPNFSWGTHHRVSTCGQLVNGL